MTVHGKIWAISRKIAEEVREVARDYSILLRLPDQDSLSDSWSSVTSNPTAEDDTLAANFDLPIYDDLDELNRWTDNFNGIHT
jgi:hypothetical protein